MRIDKKMVFSLVLWTCIFTYMGYSYTIQAPADQQPIAITISIFCDDGTILNSAEVIHVPGPKLSEIKSELLKICEV